MKDLHRSEVSLAPSLHQRLLSRAKYREGLQHMPEQPVVRTCQCLAQSW